MKVEVEIPEGEYCGDCLFCCAIWGTWDEYYSCILTYKGLEYKKDSFFLVQEDNPNRILIKHPNCPSLKVSV